jgi:hypothetical protein
VLYRLFCFSLLHEQIAWWNSLETIALVDELALAPSRSNRFQRPSNSVFGTENIEVFAFSIDRV